MFQNGFIKKHSQGSGPKYGSGSEIKGFGSTTLYSSSHHTKELRRLPRCVVAPSAEGLQLQASTNGGDMNTVLGNACTAIRFPANAKLSKESAD